MLKIQKLGTIVLKVIFSCIISERKKICVYHIYLYDMIFKKSIFKVVFKINSKSWNISSRPDLLLTLRFLFLG